MKNKITLLLTALLISVLFASMLGGSSAGAAVQPAGGVRWEATVKLQPEAARLALRDRSTLTDAMRMAGISAMLGDGSLSMKGQKDMAQIGAALFDTASPWMDFLGGTVELTIHLTSQGKPVTLNLEARSTTGYVWEVQAGEGVFLQDGEAAFNMRYRGVGVPSIQTIRLAATRTGETSIRLLYRRPWEAKSEPHAQVSLWITGDVSAIDLSDPTPAALMDEKSMPVEDSSAYAELDELKTALPASFDWRTQGIVPAVRDQGGCGSCWAFGTVGVMESAIRKAGGPLTDLSEQFLVDCNKDGWGCNGGLTATKYHFNVLGYNQGAAGAVLEAAKPYIAAPGTCTVAYNHPYKASGWQFITGSEWTMPTNDQIKSAIYTYGPVTAGVCVDNGWYSYIGGIYNSPSNTCGGSTNHQIVLVGWDDATQTWILRNSWGPGWGESGYMRIPWDQAGTKSRVGEGTSWVRYTPPTPGFFSTFSGTSPGWAAVRAPWSILYSNYYTSAGLANKVASAKHIGTYSNFTYSARMKRLGACTTCANRLIIRGYPAAFTTVYEWKPSYVFQYTNNGQFSVFEITGTGSAIALKNWTSSSAIVKGGFNALRVNASGPTMRFYINNKLVWSGSDSTRLSGTVGVGFYRNLALGRLLVDWARLTLLTTAAPPLTSLDVVAPGVEVQGGNVNMAP